MLTSAESQPVKLLFLSHSVEIFQGKLSYIAALGIKSYFLVKVKVYYTNDELNVNYGSTD